ncbi:glycosyl hydrolase 2 galactose-binding domain-containing protein [Acrocarpospora catenulata]|uniref:glycosyl hydrolase 2 galactose-binding domain-containing protein n=1 Tax=Acrocarpospora catenulata TaxID=2836182 RepID=UPI0020239E5D|nr:hypothetical protein [Acrocarpospora catenulata]
MIATQFPDTGWTLTAVPDDVAIADVPATVPGCVHTDLLAAGLIADPYLDDNETRLGWIGRTVWAYERSFRWSPDQNTETDLVCHGLDTVATVILNGGRVASTANQHRSYRFPVRHLLREGDNRLTVIFDSAYDMLLTLLPGEVAHISVTTDQDLDVAALVRAPVLRVVNG